MRIYTEYQGEQYILNFNKNDTFYPSKWTVTCKEHQSHTHPLKVSIPIDRDMYNFFKKTIIEEIADSLYGFN